MIRAVSVPNVVCLLLFLLQYKKLNIFPMFLKAWTYQLEVWDHINCVAVRIVIVLVAKLQMCGFHSVWPSGACQLFLFVQCKDLNGFDRGK